MKANGIHPNGGPAPVPEPKAPAATKERSKASIANAAAAKRRKIEGCSGPSQNQDEEDGEAFRPKKEEQREENLVKKESLPVIDRPMSTTNFGLSDEPVRNDNVPILPADQGSSIFDEFCIPDMFSAQGSEEPRAAAELPRFIPSPPAMVLASPLPLRTETETATTKEPRESILITD